MVAVLAAGLIAGAAMLGGLPVSAQTSGDPETRELLDRIERLQRDLATLQRQVYRGESPPAGTTSAGGTLAADMQVRLDELETQIRGLTGRLEETNHAISQLERKIEVVTSDMELRLEKLERGISGSNAGQTQAQGPAQTTSQAGASPPAAGRDDTTRAGGPPPASAAPSQPGVLGTLPVDRLPQGEATAAVASGTPSEGAGGVVALPDGPPKEQYDYATSFLARSDWDGAEQALAQFLAANPKHELAANAQYWLGETHYVRGDYNNAALAFAKGYKEFPQGQKGPDNLLKLGMSLANLKKKDSACATFDRLGRDFPNASQQLKSRVAAEANKLGCN